MVNTSEDAPVTMHRSKLVVVEHSAVAKDQNYVGATDAPPLGMSPKAVALSQVLADLSK